MFSKVAELAATAREPGTGVPSEIARTLPEELRRLVGRKRGAVGLGNVDDARGPIDCLYGLPRSNGLLRLSTKCPFPPTTKRAARAT